LECDGKYCYADEFLGDYAGKSRGEDRLFATALTMNILLDTWTDINGKWLHETPEEVVNNVEKAIYFLEDHYNDNRLA
jgi:hypothetical protein